nr:SMP-30/gluconolactonase/LRE family protein [Kineosporia babensis]
MWTGAVWSEGPVWLPETQRLRWSDIPSNVIMEHDAASGETYVHRREVEFTNGRTLDREGRVVQCSHGRRSIEYEIDGRPVTLVDRWGHSRLNSPNDVVVASDGSIWFTDPPYGILNPAEGHPGKLEYGGCFVFRFDPGTGELRPVVTDLQRPNGLAFSPDESLLYVSDTADEQRGRIRAYPVDVRAGSVGEGRDFATVVPGCSDGFRVDVEGRIWSSSLDAVQVISPGGVIVERIPVPEKIANLCFGGPDGQDLYVVATSSLYRIRTTTQQAARP